MINIELFKKFKYDLWAVQCTTESQANDFLKYCKEQGITNIPKYIQEKPWSNPDTYFVYNFFYNEELHKFNLKWLQEQDIKDIITYAELNTDIITLKEFKNQDNKVQSMLLKYYKQKPNDLVQIVEKRIKEPTLDIKKYNRIDWRNDFTVPLLNSDQLEEIIERITGVKINAILEDGKYTIYSLDKKYKTGTDNLLQAYLLTIHELADK